MAEHLHCTLLDRMKKLGIDAQAVKSEAICGEQAA
jgi:hypothetical protein